MDYFRAIKYQVDANFQRFLANFLSPKDVANGIVKRLGNQIIACENGLIEIKTQYKILERNKDEQIKKFENWTKRAEAALEKGQEDLAQEAALEAIKAQELIETYNEQMLQLEPEMVTLKQEIVRMKTEKDAIERRLDILSTKLTVAKARQEISLLLGGVGGNNYTQQLKQLETEALMQEAKALATVDITKELSGKKAEDKFKALESSMAFDKANQLLSDLKAGNKLLTTEKGNNGLEEAIDVDLELNEEEVT